MDFRSFDCLPEDAAAIRRAVFVEEQGFCAAEEFDAADAVARHIVLYLDGVPAATCRYFPDDGRQDYVVGRLAVRREYRGRGLGGAVLREAERQLRLLGAGRVRLAAQVRARGFYEKQGYAVAGGAFEEEHCPHVWMCKVLRREKEDG